MRTKFDLVSHPRIKADNQGCREKVGSLFLTEDKVWRDVKLPAGKILILAVVSHSTDLVEHPELVADRIITFTEVVGRENVVGGTDCGLGGRVHPQIAFKQMPLPKVNLLKRRTYPVSSDCRMRPVGKRSTSNNRWK
jgi:hypothetical protein